ncbi:hypothetical protein XU18_0988 [Perkinsela sp. CCAP 1560/4]|nr:hypothetical protein XU18_2307 [Perkinsela sp. CCAP 1560/4]KNH08419.1 hypothetical protein XU18_0988 [Perkinsela sp. CCAP 1560/4]|eukprot:KNH06949.1 hypothetical protein XU18_2307 [Perkinsela sp. CCAP 1560/4]
MKLIAAIFIISTVAVWLKLSNEIPLTFDLLCTADFLRPLKELAAECHHFMVWLAISNLSGIYEVYPEQIIALGVVATFVMLLVLVLRILVKFFLEGYIQRLVESRFKSRMAKPTGEAVHVLGSCQCDKSQISNIESKVQKLSEIVERIRKSEEMGKYSPEAPDSEVIELSSRLDKVIEKLKVWRKEWNIVKAMVISTYETKYPEGSPRLSASSDTSEFCLSLGSSLM